MEALAAKTWTHPVSGRQVQFATTTIERWYYLARNQNQDPLSALKRAVRKDCGQISLPATVAEQLTRQHGQHPHWTYQLHYDNLVAWAKASPSLGALAAVDPTTSRPVAKFLATHLQLPREVGEPPFAGDKKVIA